MTAALAIVTGVVFLVAGLARMGWIASFMSKAVMAELITCMAIQIIVGQLGKLFGVHAGSGDTFQKLCSVVSHVGQWNWTAMALGVTALALIFALQRFAPVVPAAPTAIVVAGDRCSVQSRHQLVPKIPAGLPPFAVATGISGVGLGDANTRLQDPRKFPTARAPGLLQDQPRDRNRSRAARASQE